MIRVRYLLGVAAVAAALFYAAPVPAQTIIDEWVTIKAPPAPTLKPVTADPKTTATRAGRCELGVSCFGETPSNIL